MRSVICVHERFDAVWPFAADYWQKRWQSDCCELYRTMEPEARAPQMVPDPAAVQRLVLLGLPAGSHDLAPFTSLEECFHSAHSDQSSDGLDKAASRGVHIIPHRIDIYWGQSVAEYGLCLTLCGLRRIPQSHTAMIGSLEPWKHRPEVGKPGAKGVQYCDDSRFASGTLGRQTGACRRRRQYRRPLRLLVLGHGRRRRRLGPFCSRRNLCRRRCKALLSSARACKGCRDLRADASTERGYLRVGRQGPHRTPCRTDAWSYR